MNYQRNSPKNGTPERQKLEARTRETSEVWEKESAIEAALEKEIEKTRPYTKKREGLEKKLSKSRARLHEAWAIYAEARETTYRALMEDTIEEGDEANQIAAQVKLGLIKLGGYEQVKILARQEATRIGLEGFAEQIALDVASMILAYPGAKTLVEQTKISANSLVVKLREIALFDFVDESRLPSHRKIYFRSQVQFHKYSDEQSDELKSRVALEVSK